MLDHAGPCWTMLDHAGPCWTMLDHAGPCWTMLDIEPKNKKVGDFESARPHYRFFQKECCI
jgi:hypothetical protein